jgi:ferredoxin
MINFRIEGPDGIRHLMEIPEGINLNLMEVLKASGYPILGTCGGMALCATCTVRVLEGLTQLAPATDLEETILDTLPTFDEQARLSCQLWVNNRLEGCLFKVLFE